MAYFNKTKTSVQNKEKGSRKPKHPKHSKREQHKALKAAAETKTFTGRVVVPGTTTAKALVSHVGLNTLASFQNCLQWGDKEAKCGDQNNKDLYKKPMAGAALCLPQTIGSTTGGFVLYCACAKDCQPACMLFSHPIDSLAAAGAILQDVWLDGKSMPVIDSLGDEFLDYVKDGMEITVKEGGVVEVR